MKQGRTIDRILFIRTSRPGNLCVIPPLGILYLIGAAKRDLTPAPSAMAVVNYALENLNYSRLAAKIEAFAPDLVAISGLTVEAELMARTAGLAKRANPEMVVVVGGPHASSDPADLLSTGQVDFAVIGEGEQTFVELIRCLRAGADPAGVPGLALPGERDPVLTLPRAPLEDLDRLPTPAWEMIDLAEYSARPVLTMSQSLRQTPYTVIMTSRGCPYGCIYCHKFFGRRVRARSPENVLAEMEMLHDRYGVREFHVIDDCFNYDRQRAKTICRMIAGREWNIGITFPNGIRGDLEDVELLQEMKRAGTYKIYFAIEAGSRRIQELIRRRMDLDALKRSIGQAVGLGIITSGVFMIGFPTETREEMEQTIRFACSSRLHGANFFKVVPYPGTELARLWAATSGDGPGGEDVAPSPASRRSYENYYFWSKKLPGPEGRAELVGTMQIRAYVKFFGNPVRLVRFVLRHPNRGLTLWNLWSLLCIVFRHYRDEWLKPRSVSPADVEDQTTWSPPASGRDAE